ncbi:hypothetical protein GBF38_003809 [Nibea albiflora]|uniref:Uncharacterized protein n=1 Tax=Nibea albiflora TaxID=240163 RepID=A0ACB7F4U2_NIBAL|nr:hypothetical protein GBF38_003809 [Nibea albiflora]
MSQFSSASSRYEPAHINMSLLCQLSLSPSDFELSLLSQLFLCSCRQADYTDSLLFGLSHPTNPSSQRRRHVHPSLSSQCALTAPRVKAEMLDNDFLLASHSQSSHSASDRAGRAPVRSRCESAEQRLSYELPAEIGAYSSHTYGSSVVRERS